MKTRIFNKARIGFAVVAAVCLALATIGAAPVASATPRTINHPGDGYATIQDAINAAGCGGTVLLAAGTYNERFSATCSTHIIGAGEDQTIIDGMGLDEPGGFAPLVLVGFPPTAIFPLTGDYEVAYLTIRSGPGGPTGGLVASWTQDASFHNLRVVGFENGILATLSLDTTIHDVYVQGTADDPFKGFSQCIRLSATNRFRGALPEGHITGQDIHNAVVEDCFIGINVNAAAKETIHDNTTRRTFIGMNLNGVSDSEIHHNLIVHSDMPFELPAAGIDLANTNSSVIHHNTYCHNTIAIRYSFSLTPSFAGFPPSSDNVIHHNLFSQNGQDIVLDDPNLGPGNTEFQNIDNPGLNCSP